MVVFPPPAMLPTPTPTAARALPPTRHALITVSIVDGNAAYRTALAQALARFPGVVIFDKCDSAASASRALSERPPRVLFVSDDLPDAPGWDFLETVRSGRTATQIIAISEREAVLDVQTAFRSGAVGYLLRSTPTTMIHQAIHEVVSGGAPLAPSVARALVSSYCAPRVDSGPLAELTSRESEVLDLLSRGMRYRQIAAKMQLSTETVHSHAKKVYRKLGVGSKTEAAMIWLRTVTDGGATANSLSLAVA